MTDVLLVDDAPGMGDLIGAVLEGADVRQVTNLDEAYSAVEASRPDVVLLDLNLEHEDGLGFLRHRGDDRRLQDLPVIVFSVHDSRFDEALEAGAVGCVRKPFRAQDLRAAIGPYLDKADALRAG
jgi:DNA-binding response OmpR family regulator